MNNKERDELDKERINLACQSACLNDVAYFLENTNFIEKELAISILLNEAQQRRDKSDLILKQLLNK